MPLVRRAATTPRASRLRILVGRQFKQKSENKCPGEGRPFGAVPSVNGAQHTCSPKRAIRVGDGTAVRPCLRARLNYGIVELPTHILAFRRVSLFAVIATVRLLYVGMCACRCNAYFRIFYNIPAWMSPSPLFYEPSCIVYTYLFGKSPLMLIPHWHLSHSRSSSYFNSEVRYGAYRAELDGCAALDGSILSLFLTL